MNGYNDDEDEEDWKRDPAPIKKRAVMCDMTKCDED